MALKGYNSYRGRQGFWRRLLVFVLVLILVAACGFLFLQRYITYSDDGSFRLELPFEINWEFPFWNDEEQNGDEVYEPQQDVNLIVDRPQEDEEQIAEDDQLPDDSQTSGDQEQSEQPKEEPYLPPRLIELSDLPQDEAALIDALAAVGADGFVFRAKKDLGKVAYTSAVALGNAIEENAVSRELLGRLCAQEDVYTVASINCFHDSVYAFANMAAAGICQSNGYIWYDYDLQHWLDPEKEGARQYLIALAVECAQLGFDELMLEDLCYPTWGKLYKIDYSKNTMAKTDALILFLTELEAALEPYGVRISLRLEEQLVRAPAEDIADSGFDACVILPLVDAVYVATIDAEAVRQDMSMLLAGENIPVLVPVVGEVTTENSWCLVG
ncbi:MAG: hypothetical protein IKM11_06380 [Oscillospiraceae bacterium]|nr:hypothetical protein [Oscillospiraceae bacterium]